MFCENPNGKFPCGKCRACKLRLVNEKMIISIFAAHEYRKKGQFLTLTYNDENLTDGLYYPDFALFMKRLRRLDGTRFVKMFVAGEYGEDSGREHWHVLFYNYRYPLDLLRKAWNKGFVYDGTLTPQSMKYVSGYVNKKGYCPDSGKRPPFGRSSCNLPDGLSPDEILSMSKTGKVQYNGRKFSVPRNWRRRYQQIWKRFEEERSWYNFEQPHHDLTPDIVRAMMDIRDMNIARRRKKRIYFFSSEKAHNVYYVYFPNITNRFVVFGQAATQTARCLFSLARLYNIICVMRFDWTNRLLWVVWCG